MRFDSTDRSRQIGFLNSGFQKGLFFFSSSKAKRLLGQTVRFQVLLSPFYLVRLKVQIDPLKNMHIRLENHQPLRVRHLLF